MLGELLHKFFDQEMFIFYLEIKSACDWLDIIKTNLFLVFTGKTWNMSVHQP